MDLQERLIANKAKGMYFVWMNQMLIRDEKGRKGSWFDFL